MATIRNIITPDGATYSIDNVGAPTDEQVQDAVNVWLTAHPEVTTTVEDGSITLSKLASDIHDDVASIPDLMNAIATKGGLTADIKEALLACFRNVPFIKDNGCYDALEDALYPPANLYRISAVFNQGTTVIYEGASLDSLKPYLTVTAYYDDGTSGAVTTYGLTGRLSAGTSTITVVYGGKETTFTVNVTADDFGTLLYHLEDVTYDGTNYTLTNFKIWDSDKDFSIFVDIDPNGNDNNEHTVFGCNKLTSPWNGIKLATFKVGTNYLYSLRIMSSQTSTSSAADTTIPSTADSNIKFVITHESGTQIYKLYSLYNGSVSSASLVAEFLANDRPMIVGADTGGNSYARYWYGAMNTLEVYDTAWTEAEVNLKLG